MKPSNLIIRIPEPCHEDWNAMQPDAKGKFCSSCSKSVIDFSAKTDTEINTILMEYKDQNVCGHFKKTQIDRPLNISINIKDLPKNISMTKAFAVAVFIVFGTLLFSCTDEKGKEINAIELVNSEHTLGEPVLPKSLMLTMDTLQKKVPLTEISYLPEMHAAGGVSIEEYPVPSIDTTGVTVVPVIDSAVMLEPRIMGMMMYRIPPRVDSLANDTTVLNDTENTQQKLFNVYPNPSSGEFTVKYKLAKKADVNLSIYDMNGSLIRNVVNVSGQYEGRYQIPVSLNDVPSGIYIVSFIKGDEKSTERVVIAR